MNGWTTLLVNAFMAHKMRTMTMGGGNSHDLYGMDGGDQRERTDTRGRYEMARSLEERWPGLVKTGRRFGRFQHTVNWGAFKTPFSPATGEFPAVNEYGLTLEAVRPPESPYVRKVYETFADEIQETPAFDGIWRGLPGFRARTPPPQLRIECTSAKERDAFVAATGVRVSKKNRESHSAWWPPRRKQDLASLRFTVKGEA